VHTSIAPQVHEADLSQSVPLAVRDRDEGVLVRTAGGGCEAGPHKSLAPVGTCCRQGEMLRIQNRHVDWEQHQIAIPGSKAKDRENRRVPFDPKGRLAPILRRRAALGPNAYSSVERLGQDRADRKICWFSEQNWRALQDSNPGSPETVMLTFGYWHTRFGGIHPWSASGSVP
jgi:hypothetical protein